MRYEKILGRYLLTYLGICYVMYLMMYILYISVTSVLEFEGAELMGCRFLATHKSIWWLYFVGMTLDEFGLSHKN